MKENINTLNECPFCHSTFELLTYAGSGDVMFECPLHKHNNLEFGVWGWKGPSKEIWALNVVINQKQVCFNFRQNKTRILKRTNYKDDDNGKVEILCIPNLIHFVFEKEKFENKIKTLITFI